MDGISISRDDINNLAENIETINTKKIDGGVLANLIRTCFGCALKTKEIIEITIGDVAENGVVQDKIKKPPINLSTSVKQMLQDHLGYLKQKGYCVYSEKPLFPAVGGSEYGGRTLNNHLKKAMGEEYRPLSKIRNAGIRQYYNELKKSKKDESELVWKTSEFARLSDNQVKDLQRSKKTVRKAKPNHFSEYLREIESAPFKNGRDSSRSFEALQEILAQIKSDNVLRSIEKEELESCIKKMISDIPTLCENDDQPKGEKIVDSLSDAIKNHKDDSKPNSSVDDIIDYFELKKKNKK